MTSSSKKPYYSVDLTYRVGDLVALVDMRNPSRTINPTICRVLSVERPPRQYGLTDQKLHLECIKTGLTAKMHGAEVLKYDTYLIFAIMGTMSRLIEAHFGERHSLP